MKAICKIWLDNEGKAFGKGPQELLKRVEATSSLNQAASQMGMSYSKAWRLIRTMEKRLGFFLLERTIGGPEGGGSRLTPKGRDLMNRYEMFEREATEAVEQIYARCFNARSQKEEEG